MLVERRTRRRRLGARQGFPRHRHRPRRRAPRRGRRVMLYHLLYSLSPQIGALNVTRYITFRTAAASISALLISLVMGPWLIRTLREFQIGQVIRQEGPPVASGQSRHANHGRVADSRRGPRAHAALGRPDQCVHLDRRHLDGGLRCGGLLRRLPQDHTTVVGRPGAALQGGRADRRRPGGGRHAVVAGVAQPLQHAPHLPVLQAAHSRSRLVLPALLRVAADLVDERRQPHRRSRRPGHQHLCRGRRLLHRARLRDRPRRVRGVPACSCAFPPPPS